MKKLELGQTITILANIGVVAGIVFLAIEVNQNQMSLDQSNLLNRAEVLTEALDHFNDFRALTAQDEQLSQLWDRGRAGDELSPMEARRFQDLCQNNFWIFATLHQRFVLLGEEMIAERGPADTVRLAMQNWDGLRECWLPLMDDARNWGYGSLPDALESSEE